MREIKSFLITPLIEFSNNSFWRLFFIVSFLNFISTIIYNHFVWSDTVYLNESGLNVSNSIFIEGSKNREILNYVTDLISPIWLFFKLGCASCFIYIVAYLNRMEIVFKDIYKFLVTSFIFIVFGDFIYSLILIFLKEPFFRNDILHYYPLSILSLLSPESDLNQYYFILSRINVFQIIFIFSIFLLFRNQNNISLKHSFFLVFSYVFFYGLFLVCWLLLLI